MTDQYQLIDSGHGRKLERFGDRVLARPCSQAVWPPSLPPAEWQKADASFSREGGLKWNNRQALPDEWTVPIADIRFKLSTTDFGHLGVFPEQRQQWNSIREAIQKADGTPVRVLNLFAYSGGSTLAAALAGADVCHLDASKGMVDWARENAALNGLDKAPIRWIVDDALKFMRRELRRDRRYDAIILDPPSFGRGSKGEVFKIEKALPELLDLCRQLLSDRPCFMLLSCHTPGYSPIVLKNMLIQTLAAPAKLIKEGEMLLTGKPGVLPVPSGTYAFWRPSL